MINHTMYVLAVADLNATATFFSDVLGFKVHDLGDPGWRMFVRDSCRLMAGHCPDAMPATELGDHSYFAYWVVEDVDTFYQEVVNKGAELVKPLRSEPWGMREFGLRTPDGHRIMIGQDLSESAS